MKQLQIDTLRKWYEVGYRLHNWPQPDWGNPASDEQRRLFFALCKELGLESEVAKERAKKSYCLLSFSHVSKSQISTLIEKLQRNIEERREHASLQTQKVN